MYVYVEYLKVDIKWYMMNKCITQYFDQKIYLKTGEEFTNGIKDRKV